MQIDLNKDRKTKKIKKVRGNKWMEKIYQYLEKLKMEYNDNKVMDNGEIKEITKDYDDGNGRKN